MTLMIKTISSKNIIFFWSKKFSKKVCDFQKIFFWNSKKFENFHWIPLVLRFFQRFFHSTPSNSVLRELLNPGGCLGTPSASPLPPPLAGRSPAFWLPRNSQFRDLSQRGIECPDVSVMLHVTGDVTLDSGSQWRHATWSFLMTSYRQLPTRSCVNQL